MQVISFPLAPEQFQFLSDLFLKGAVFIFPTETFYAVGCVAVHSEAIDKIYSLKGRSEQKPLLVLVKDWEMIARYVVPLNKEAREKLDPYWPGALTVIFENVVGLSNKLNHKGDGVGIRMTSSSYARDLIHLAGVPIVGTSCNLAGQEAAKNVCEAMAQFGDKVDLYFDGGQAPGGLASTVVDLRNIQDPKILRQGSVAFI